MVKIAVVLLAILSLVLAGSAPPVAPPLPADAYWDRVEATRALVTELHDATYTVQRARLQEAAYQWEEITAVLLPDGPVVPIDSSFLVTHLRADPPDLEELGQLLDALLSTRGQLSHPARTTADLSALDEVLARDEFRWEEATVDEPSDPTWLQRLSDGIDRFFSNLFGGVGGSGQGLQYLLIGLGGTALAVILFYVVRGLLADLVAESRDKGEEGDEEEALTAEAALKRAETLAGAHDYRTAVRYLYLSSLLLLEERGLLRYKRSSTNREYLRSISHLPELSGVLQDVVDVFERVWYGYQPLDEAAYARYEARIDELDDMR